MRPRQARVWQGLLGLVCLVFWLASAHAQAQAVQVDSRARINLWPGVTILAETNTRYTAEALLAQPQLFNAPTGVSSNLGRQSQNPVWLRVLLEVPALPTGSAPVQRVLELDYPALEKMDLSLWRDGQRVAQHRMGRGVPMAARPLPARTHAAALDLQPGHYVLLLRLHTPASLVLPLTLHTQADFTHYESQAHLTQGLLLGGALCMLLYSLAHWFSLRDAVFLDYALLLAGNTLFCLSHFGTGVLWLWPDRPDWSIGLSTLGLMAAVVAGTRFSRTTLAVREFSPLMDGVLRVTGTAAPLGLLAFASGLIGVRSIQTLVMMLGLVTTVTVLIACVWRSRRSSAVDRYMLLGWSAYTAGAVTFAALLQGYIEPTFWIQQIYPLACFTEMAAWLAVLGERVKSIHGNANRARVESETLRAMAHTDALTGLPNRRGLSLHLDPALHSATPENLVAVYMLDLDGFKPINDRYGHDVGDALLVAVGQRLKDALRGPDVVARIGGDEFVVLAAGLKEEHAAHALGMKLLSTFQRPFEVNGLRCDVGLTVGYALAPLDGRTAETVLKRADEAMYLGKHQGRRRVLRTQRLASPAAPAQATQTAQAAQLETAH